MTDLPDLSAARAARLIADGALDPRGYAEAFAERIAAGEGALRAFRYFDPAALRACARADPATGPLRGLPVGVKDVIDTAEMPTEYGSPAWAGHRPRADAACVAMVRAAGAVIAGKTVTTEFATRHPGPTRNPHDPARTPGGSSSGSAAGVAARFFPLAFGTQTGGSVIRPAAFCGVVGFKPSFGLIHRGGMRVMSETLDTIGTMARDLAGCALLAGAAAGLDLGDPERGTGTAPRVALCLQPARDILEAETVIALDAAAATLSRAGARVDTLLLPDAVLRAAAAHPVVMHGESRQALAWELSNVPEQLSDDLHEPMDWAGRLPPGALPEARATLAAARAAFHDVMRDHDLILTAAAPGEAPLGLESTGNPACNALWTALHVPCVTVPFGSGAHGMPLGAQFVGGFGRDREVLAWSEWARAALNG